MLLKPSEHRTILIAIDLIAAILAVLFALWVWALRAQVAFDWFYLLSQAEWFLLALLWFVLATANGMYDLTTAADLRRILRALLRTEAFLLLVYLVIYFFSRPSSLPRGVVLYDSLATLGFVGMWRIAYITHLHRFDRKRRALIVGAGWAGSTIAQAVHEHFASYYELIGYVDDDAAKQGQAIEGIPVLGTRHELGALVRANNVSEVILAITNELPGEIFQALLECQELGVQITPMSMLYEEITGQVPVHHIGDNWYLGLPLNHAGTGGFYPLVKRALDILAASIGLTLLGLALPLIALAIYLDSPGPIFYKQERVGKGGKVFKVFKLRTMVPQAERAGEAVWATNNDPRITRVGRLLRKTRLDEFPQFINIVRGEMSAVGPRPERPEFEAELEKHIPFCRLRHAAKPGMAGWAMVNHGYVASIEDARIRLQYDLYYIKHQSIWLDLLILLRAIGQIIALKGR